MTNQHILAFTRQLAGEVVLVVANLSRFVQPAAIDLRAHAGSLPVELIGGARFPRIGDGPYFLSLGPHTFYWFDLQPRTADVASAG